MSQTGGVIGRTEPQQILHTQPSKGLSRIELQTAHSGARVAVTNALQHVVISDWGLVLGTVTVSRVNAGGFDDNRSTHHKVMMTCRRRDL